MNWYGMDGVLALRPPAGRPAGNTTLGILPLLLGGGSLGTTLRDARFASAS